MSKVAIILSGCGFLDGSEIQETVLTLLALENNNISYDCYAPNRTQSDSINHLTQKETSEVKNILEESARITRGNIKPLSNLNSDNYQGLILPGGYGIAKSFFNFAEDGIHANVENDIKTVIEEFYNEGKIIGALCISPVLVGKVLYKHNPILTAGNTENCQTFLDPLGIKYQTLPSEDICVDEKNKIVSTPAYMNDGSLKNVSVGINKLVKYIASQLHSNNYDQEVA